MRSLCIAAKSSPSSPQLEKACTQQWRSSAAKNKYFKNCYFYFFSKVNKLTLFIKIYLFIFIFFYFTILYWFCHTSICICHGCTRNIQPWHTAFPILNQPVAPCPFLNAASWSAYRFLRKQVRQSCIPISIRIFHSFLWSTQSMVFFISYISQNIWGRNISTMIISSLQWRRRNLEKFNTI